MQGRAFYVKFFCFQVTFEGIRGSSYTSDIAIDDVTVMEGNCPGRKFITFDVSFNQYLTFFNGVFNKARKLR